MKEEIKNIWVSALRSGEFEQGQGALCSVTSKEDNTLDSKYCCLGVLCYLANKNFSIIGSKLNSRGKVKFDHETDYLPKKVQDRAGMKSCFGVYDEETFTEEFNAAESTGTLAGLNDDGASFEEIAAVIEDKWEIL